MLILCNDARGTDDARSFNIVTMWTEKQTVCFYSSDHESSGKKTENCSGVTLYLDFN